MAFPSLGPARHELFDVILSFLNIRTSPPYDRLRPGIDDQAVVHKVMKDFQSLLQTPVLIPIDVVGHSWISTSTAGRKHLVEFQKAFKSLIDDSEAAKTPRHTIITFKHDGTNVAEVMYDRIDGAVTFSRGHREGLHAAP